MMRLFIGQLKIYKIFAKQKLAGRASNVRLAAFLLALTGLTFSCIPDYLKKYRGSSGAGSNELETSRQNGFTNNSQEDPLNSPDPFAPIDTDPAPRLGSTGSEPQGFFTQKSTSKSASNSGSTLVKSAQTVLYKANTKDVWDAALKVLLMNYNITLLDKELGVISTDWDNYYQADRLLRNKVTMHIKKTSWVTSEVTINSSLEKYSISVSDVTYNKELTETGLWLPDTDQGIESSRIFKNIARLLNLTEPVFPYISPSISQDQKPPDQKNQRPY